MKCPFNDPTYKLPVNASCPVCGLTGNFDDWVGSEAEKLCSIASEDGENHETQSSSSASSTR